MTVYETLKMIYGKYKPGRCLSLLAVAFFVFYTLTNGYIHEFNTDELWGWDIAADMNLTDIFKLMRYEQHTILWYLILKPFTYFDNMYPMIMKYINWTFVFLFLCAFHIYAPINRSLKILITLSLPFMIIYPFTARIYGIGLFLLLLLTAFYKKRLSNPVLYAVLIFLTANNSLMTALGAFSFSIVFIYDLIKNYTDKRKIILPLCIVIFAFLFLFLQWHNPVIGEHAYSDIVINLRRKNIYDFLFTYKNIILHYFSFVVIILGIPSAVFLNFYKEKKASLRWFIIAGLPVIMISIIFFFFYNAKFHHLYFIYIYFIMLYWLKIENEQSFIHNGISYKSYTLMLYIVSVMLFFPFKETDFWCFDISSYRDSALEIKKYVPQNSKIYVVLELCQGLIPYLKNDYELSDINGNKIPSFDSYKNVYHSLNNFIVPKDIKILDKNENVYYLISGIYLNYYEKDIGIDRNDLISVHNGDYFLYKISGD